MTVEFTIVGAGAIGGVTAAFLARAGHRVTLVDVAADHVAAIRARGLKIRGHADITVRVPALLPDQLRGPLGAVILAVKSYSTEAALEPLVPLLADDGYVVSLQNGLEEYKIAQKVGRGRTIGAYLTFGAHYEAPGEVVYGGPGSLAIGELDGSVTPRLLRLQQALSAIQPVEITDNIFGHLWAKLALGSVYMGTALVNADVTAIYDRPEYRAVLEDLCAETVAVAEALGVKLEDCDGFDPRAMRFGQRDPVAVQASWDAQRAYWNGHVQKRTGIWRDLAVRKRKTEADRLLHTVVAEGERLGIPTPRIRAVHRLIKEVEAGRRTLSWSNLDEVQAAAK